jgi:exopolysaccharide production protein ExoZ
VFTLYSNPIVWNFIAGIAIYHVHQIPFVKREAPLIFAAGVLLLLSSMFWHIADASFGLRQFLPWGVPSMMIVLGAVGMEVAGKGKRLFGSRIMLALGNASYALYLVHTMCFIGVSLLLFYKLKVQDYVGPDGAVLAFLAVTCVLAIAVHHLIEKPATRYVRKAIAAGSAVISGRDVRA